MSVTDEKRVVRIWSDLGSQKSYHLLETRIQEESKNKECTFSPFFKYAFQKIYIDISKNELFSLKYSYLIYFN